MGAIMHYLTIILAIYGVIDLIFKLLKYTIFKVNIKFHKVLESFKFISESKTNKLVKQEIKGITHLKFDEKYSEMIDIKQLDWFIANLEKIKTSKFLICKKKRITNFIDNLIRVYETESASIEMEVVVDTKTNKIKEKSIKKANDLSMISIHVTNKIMGDTSKINKLYVCRFLGF